MKKNTLTKLLLTILITLLISFTAFALDYPHNDANYYGCSNCHDFFSSNPYLVSDWTGGYTMQDADDTPLNHLCRSCHYAGGPTRAHDVHSYIGVGYTSAGESRYGPWQVECSTCHNPHEHDQFLHNRDTGDTYWQVKLLVDTVTVSDTTSTLKAQDNPNWTVDEHKDLRLVPNIDSRYPAVYKITGNDADTLTIKGQMNISDVSNGDSFAIIYSKLVRKYIRLDRITNPMSPRSGWKMVKLFNASGTNSFADGDTTYDGVCEVCHKETTHFRSDGSGPDQKHVNISGVVGTNCTRCHKAEKGFRGACDVCHGEPPVDPGTLVSSPGPTGSTTAGAHDKHVNTKSFECENCHYDSVGGGPTHNFNYPVDITIGFYLFGGDYRGGTYDGQASATYDTSEASTTVTNTGTKTCNNLYCHSNAAPFDGANEYKQPVWDGSVTCASCHDAGGSSTELSARHGKHTDGATYSFDCEKCHDQTASGSSAIKNQPYHVNNAKDIVFSASGTYSSIPKTCTSTYCHSDGDGGAPNVAVAWTSSETAGHAPCDSCHNGRTNLDVLEMSTNGHDILVSSQWIREYPCYYCHDATVDNALDIKDYSKHANEVKDVVIDSNWYITGNPDPSYNSDTKVCDNIYCHSDGTTVDPEVRPFAWTEEQAKCNTCHGHSNNTCSDCHDDGRTAWPVGEEWKAAMPMYANTGVGTERANTHLRHLLTDFTCDKCHVNTIANGSCSSQGCHSGTPSGSMTEVNHINPVYHVNKVKDVAFKDGGTYDQGEKKCSTTACHNGADPEWGDSVNNQIICYTCHGTTDPDVDDFAKFNGIQARINMDEWEDTGHGRPTSSGNYDSGNPPANFPGNPCWYCHDNSILHNDTSNPFRLRQHQQFENRFEKECIYCHMEGLDSECMNCHNASGSLAPQLATLTAPPFSEDHTGYTDGQTSCVDTCHATDAQRHNTDSGIWSKDEKADIQNQYMMMGVCLQCHDDDSNNRCSQCHQGPQYQLGFDPGTGFISATTSKATSTHFGYKHYAAYTSSRDTQLASGTASTTSTVNNELVDSSKSWTDDEWQDSYVMMTGGSNDTEYRKISSNTSDAITVDADFTNPTQSGDAYYLYQPVWKGGKFCWDCHDPHGDSNIYMIQDKVATETDGVYGVPVSRRDVSFTRKLTGLDYARTSAPFNGICNVCHSEGKQHYRFDYGDGHNAGRVCTTCHEHRFSDSHASGKVCTECHQNKPVPRHTAFGLPRDCTKCHNGVIYGRMDIMGQLRSNSHHIQGVEITNKHCYACHWEATDVGLINVDYHSGYNYKTNESTKNDPVDLVIWGSGTRPTNYNVGTTAISFEKSKIGTVDERSEVAEITQMCISCHSDKNNDTQPFNIVDPLNGDCKTPRQYAWDGLSIEARYSQTGTTTWGKYTGVANAAKKNITKAFSAHGNAVANQGGWNTSTGEDGTLQNTRNGSYNVQCYDCHNSHGSKAEGITSSYKTFNGTYNGGNMKETQAGKGGYLMTYKPTKNEDTESVNPYNDGAGLCFDCHETETAGTKPWGYFSTFGAAMPIIGYKDTSRFGEGVNGSDVRFPYRSGNPVLGGHFSASSDLKGLDGTPGTGDENMGTINGLCTPCHDPHGVSPTLGDNQKYAVPLLKGTWMTSPYQEDAPTARKGSKGYRNPALSWWTDRRTFGGERINENPSQFAGLCLSCHPKENLTDGINKNTAFKSLDRVHESIKGWGNNEEHSWTCSKCHQPHSAGLPRLLKTNCLDYNHVQRVVSGGMYGQYGSKRHPRSYNTSWVCHESPNAAGGSWTQQKWNTVTPW